MLKKEKNSPVCTIFIGICEVLQRKRPSMLSDGNIFLPDTASLIFLTKFKNCCKCLSGKSGVLPPFHFPKTKQLDVSTK